MTESSQKIFVRDATGLVRQLGFGDQFLISQVALNWFGGLPLVALSAPFFFPGASLPLVVLLGSIPAFALAVVYSRLSAAMPRSGGDYVWSTRILGPAYGAVQLAFLATGYIVLNVTLNAYLFSTVGLAQVFFTSGIAASSKSILSLAVSMGHVGLGYPLTMLNIIGATLVAVFGLRAYSWAQRVGYVFVYVIAAVFLVGLFVTNFSNLPTLFDNAMRLSGYNATYSGVISQASSQAPQAVNFSLTNTLLAAIPWGFLTYTGLNWGSYLAGETKNVRTTMPRALLLSMLFSVIVLVVYFTTFDNVFGVTFLNAASYVAANNPSYLPALPTVSLMFSLENPALGTLVGIAITATLFLGNVFYVMMLSRMLFAASFDRLLPARFSKVSDRFHSPHIVTIFVGAVAAVWLTIYWNFGFAATYLNASLISPIAYCLPLIAILLFPIVKKDLYRQVMATLGSNVVTFVAAAVALICFVIYAFAETVPILSGVFLGTALTIAFGALGGTLLLGLLIYALARRRAGREGIKLSRIYSEIPPE